MAYSGPYTFPARSGLPVVAIIPDILRSFRSPQTEETLKKEAHQPIASHCLLVQKSPFNLAFLSENRNTSKKDDSKKNET